MKNMLKEARIKKGLKTTEVANLLDIDAALISKFESGQRVPTRPQLLNLSKLLDIDFDNILILYLKEKILKELANEPLAEKVLQAALSQITSKEPDSAATLSFQKLMDEMESLKSILSASAKNQ
ncbi:MAG TPA: helix-turn-helix transcriptional regulator [Flavobacterium sp.]|nr:helix-turn-helix transcriptional regulator [Flavobacterium sp.]